jgi:phosphoribosylanthranilate isomerase
MQRVSKPRVKICCIGSVEEAWLAISYGASAIGLVSEMPSGPGVVREDLIIEIAAIVPPPIASFLLTCKPDAESIIAQQRRCRTNTIQLCDRLEHESYAPMREALPGVPLVQVVHVGGEESLTEALSVAPQVNAILLDSGNQSLPVKELGGTGRAHDWAVSARIRERLNVPIFLAGGLRAENVREAVERVGPFGLDVCSGVRSAGKLDERKLNDFFRQLN